MSVNRVIYDHLQPNEWYTPIPRGYRLACCDCGLVHTMDLRIRKGKIQVRWNRHERATAGIRQRKHEFVRRK